MTCANCREEGETFTVKISESLYEDWCGFCADGKFARAKKCEICKVLVDENYAYQISQGLSDPNYLCPDICALTYVLDKSLR